jgi:hypothetical protein
MDRDDRAKQTFIQTQSRTRNSECYLDGVCLKNFSKSFKSLDFHSLHSSLINDARSINFDGTKMSSECMLKFGLTM